jgi:hypothetical protein
MLSIVAEIVGVHNPVYMEAEVVGRGIRVISQIAGRREDDGRYQLLEITQLQPTLVDKTQNDSWRAGTHNVQSTWTGEAAYLSDNINGDFVMLTTPNPNSPHRIIPGYHHSLGQETSIQSEAYFDVESGRLLFFLDSLSGARIESAPGDSFQVINYFITENREILQEPGLTFRLNENEGLEFDVRALSEGNYFLGFMAESSENSNVLVLDSIDVDSTSAVPGYRAHLDPTFGFQFLIPADWKSSTVGEGKVSFKDAENVVDMTITELAMIPGRSASELKARVLQAYGPVQILFEDQVSLGGWAALRTAYGYESEDGPHTGIFLIFTKDGTGYVIDVDGIMTNESMVVEMIQLLSDSWQFRALSVDPSLAKWKKETIGDLTISVPKNLDYFELDSGWHRYTSDDHNLFIAIRYDFTDEPDKNVDDWLQVAMKDLRDFSASESYSLELSDTQWIRRDIQFTDPKGVIVRGYIMSAISNGRSITFWVEAPADNFIDLEAKVFLTVAASIDKN